MERPNEYTVIKKESGEFILTHPDWPVFSSEVIREFDHYPSEEEVEASIAMSRILR